MKVAALGLLCAALISGCGSSGASKTELHKAYKQGFVAGREASEAQGLSDYNAGYSAGQKAGEQEAEEASEDAEELERELNTEAEVSAEDEDSGQRVEVEEAEAEAEEAAQQAEEAEEVAAEYEEEAEHQRRCELYDYCP